MYKDLKKMVNADTGSTFAIIGESSRLNLGVRTTYENGYVRVRLRVEPKEGESIDFRSNLSLPETPKVKDFYKATASYASTTIDMRVGGGRCWVAPSVKDLTKHLKTNPTGSLWNQICNLSVGFTMFISERDFNDLLIASYTEDLEQTAKKKEEPMLNPKGKLNSSDIVNPQYQESAAPKKCKTPKQSSGIVDI